MLRFLYNKDFKQLIMYFFVGCVSAVVEWVCFFILSVIRISYIPATIIAFIFSTTTNLILGRLWAFKPEDGYLSKKGTEGILIFLVSGIGLVFNILIMFVLVNTFRVETPLLKTICKIASTGIVFLWNYYMRKYIIYRIK